MAIDIHPCAPTTQAEIDKIDLKLVSKDGCWHRIHPSKYSPLHFSKEAEFRFDDPQMKFGVLYVAENEDGAFVETLARTLGTRLVSDYQLAARSISIIKVNALNVVDLTAEGAMIAGVDGRLCTADYMLTQPWSRAFHEHSAKPDGILFRARHDLSCLCMAIYDRAASKVVLKKTTRLMSLAGKKILVPIMTIYQYGLASTGPAGKKKRP